MTPRQSAVDPAKGVLEVEWPLFGELSRALALKVAREFDPELVVGIANAGVIPGATIAAILDRPFYAIRVSRRHRTETVRETPAIFGEAPTDVRDRRVLLVDETCDSGDTLRLAVSAVRTGAYEPDFYALATESTIVLPWDREVLVEGELVVNPRYAGLIG